MDPQQPYVVIGLPEIFAELVRLRASVDRLVAREDETTKDVVDHEARLRALERARWPLPSLAVLVSLASLVLALLR
jgi:hypothetical protein